MEVSRIYNAVAPHANIYESFHKAQIEIVGLPTACRRRSLRA